MTIGRTTAAQSTTSAGPGATAHATAGKQTLVQQLPPPDPRVAAATDLATQLATIGDATHQLEHTVVPGWYKALDRLRAGEVEIAGATAMMQWSRIALTEAQVGAQHVALAPIIQLARNQIAKLGLRRAGDAVISANLKVLDGDPMPFIQARIAEARTCVARVRHIMDLTTLDEHGQRVLDAAGRTELGLLLDAYPDPIQVRWIEAACANHKLSLRAQDDSHGHVRNRLRHAQDHADLSHKAQDDVDPAVAEQMSSDCDRLIALVNDNAREGRYVEVVRKYAPKQRALFLTIVKQRNVLFNMVQVAGGDNADDLVAAIREAPGYEGFGHDASRATLVDLNMDHARLEIGKEMARQAPGAITRAAAGAVDSFSSIPLIGRATHWAADKLRAGSDALYDATGASKTGRGFANLSSELAGGFAASAATMKVSSGFEAVAAGKAALETADAASTIQNVIESIHEFGEVIEGASEAWKIFAEIGSVAFATVVDAASDTATHDPRLRQRALAGLGTLIDVYLKRLEPAEKATGDGVGHQIRVTILAAMGAMLKEIKKGLLAAAEKQEAVDAKELAVAAMAGFINGATFGTLKDRLNGYIGGFIIDTTSKILNRDHPNLVAMVKTVGEKPLKRLIDFVEEKLEVEKKLQGALEPMVARLAGVHAEHGEAEHGGGEHAEHEPAAHGHAAGHA